VLPCRKYSNGPRGACTSRRTQITCTCALCHASSLFDFYVRRVSSQILYAPLFAADTYEYSSISINSILASLYTAPDLKRQEAAAATSCVATCHWTAWSASYLASSYHQWQIQRRTSSIYLTELSMPRFISDRLSTSQKMIAPCMVLYRISALFAISRNACSNNSFRAWLNIQRKIK
jgi:hypothetical protein